MDELEKTALHPSVKVSFGLLIATQSVNHYSPLVLDGYQRNTSDIQQVQEECGSPDLNDCQWISAYEEGFQTFRERTPGAGAYFSEADFFEQDFQENFWGTENYAMLKDIKMVWDPTGLFYCHHCVGSEEWDEGGMYRKQN